MIGLRKWWKRILYTFCFFVFCLIDQQTKIQNSGTGIQEAFRNLTGVLMALIIISGFRKEDLVRRRRIYIGWSIASAIAGSIAVGWALKNRPCLIDWCVLVVAVILFGFIILHTFFVCCVDKKCPKLNKRFACLWLVMMILMIVSRSRFIWPACYLVMFGCFYLTDYSDEIREDLFQGILNGIILAYFVFQIYCCMFRPYDNLRYNGIYSNCNLNALFCLETLAAVFAKILYLTRKNKSRVVRIFFWLVAGSVYGFLFMTIGRTAWLVSFVMGLVFLCGLKRVTAKRNFWKNGCLLLLCACLMLPVSFCTARYLPPVFHHPVWFWGEWNENKVHSWDPWNSEKYIDADELLDAAIGRVVKTIWEIIEQSPFYIRAEAAENIEKPVPLVPDAQREDTIVVRKAIYSEFFRNLNLWGHPREEYVIYVYYGYWADHAHNLYLQYGTDFGVIMLACFIALIVWSYILLIRNMREAADVQSMGYLLFLMVITLFGLLEYSWGTGSLTVITMFMAWGYCLRIRKEDAVKGLLTGGVWSDACENG